MFLPTPTSNVVSGSGAVNDPRAAEILLRRLQRPRPVAEAPGVDLDSMSEAQLETLHAGLVRIAALPSSELQALVEPVCGERRRLSSKPRGNAV
jgi:hypothetical protein